MGNPFAGRRAPVHIVFALMLATFGLLADPAFGQLSHDELIAQGFTRQPDENGKAIWTRPVNAMGQALTRMMGGNCSSGMCGSEAQQGGCSGGMCSTNAQQGCADGSCGLMQKGGGLFQRSEKPLQPRLSEWAPKPKEKPAAEPEAKPTQTAAAPTIDADALAEKLLDKLASDPRFKGPKGEDGQPGPAGPAGPPGPQGDAVRDAVVNYDELTAAVIARLPPIHVQNYDRNGKLVDEESYPVGTPIRLRHGSLTGADPTPIN